MTNAQDCLNKLREELLGKDYYIVSPVGGNQANEIITEDIIEKYKSISFLDKVKSTFDIQGYNMSKITIIAQIIEKYELLLEEIKDVEFSLKKIRGMESWEKDIDKDTRPSVQLLYSNLVSIREELHKFMSTTVKQITLKE